MRYWLLMFSVYVIPVVLIGGAVYLFFAVDLTGGTTPDDEEIERRDSRRSRAVGCRLLARITRHMA